MIRIGAAVRLVPALALIGFIPQPGLAQDAAAVIEYRQDVMQGLAMHSGAIRVIREGTLSLPEHVLPHALALQGLADMLPPLFPAGSGEGETRALPAVWERSADFAAAVTAMRTSASELVSAARSGDGAAIDAARAAVGQACSGCHGDFRARPARGGGAGN